MKTVSPCFSLALAAILVPVASFAADTLTDLAAAAKVPARYADHKPAFSAAKESFSFSSDGKAQEFWTIKDGDRYVAVLQESSAQLDMITFDPGRTAEKPPFQEYYSWGKLLGTRILATAWVGDMRPTGKVVYGFSEGGETLTLSTVQTWPDRKGSCRYKMTLRVDPVWGYVWDCETDFDTDQPPMHEVDRKGVKTREPDRVEMFNWQVRVTGWTKRHNNPRWPAAWTHERTLFQRKDGAFVGFWNNPDAVDRSRFKRTDVMEGGFVAMGPDAEGWGIALAHLKKGRYSINNNTCNMWADSHNYLVFPSEPDADGLYRMSAAWRFQAVPPEVLSVLLEKAEMDDMGKAEWNDKRP